jgi:hypothetical protein
MVIMDIEKLPEAKDARSALPELLNSFYSKNGF